MIALIRRIIVAICLLMAVAVALLRFSSIAAADGLVNPPAKPAVSLPPAPVSVDVNSSNPAASVPVAPSPPVAASVPAVPSAPAAAPAPVSATVTSSQPAQSAPVSVGVDTSHPAASVQVSTQPAMAPAAPSAPAAPAAQVQTSVTTTGAPAVAVHASASSPAPAGARQTSAQVVVTAPSPAAPTRATASVSGPTTTMTVSATGAQPSVSVSANTSLPVQNSPSGSVQASVPGSPSLSAQVTAPAVQVQVSAPASQASHLDQPSNPASGEATAPLSQGPDTSSALTTQGAAPEPSRHGEALAGGAVAARRGLTTAPATIARNHEVITARTSNAGPSFSQTRTSSAPPPAASSPSDRAQGADSAPDSSSPSNVSATGSVVNMIGARAHTPVRLLSPAGIQTLAHSLRSASGAAPQAVAASISGETAVHTKVRHGAGSRAARQGHRARMAAVRPAKITTRMRTASIRQAPLPAYISPAPMPEGGVAGIAPSHLTVRYATAPASRPSQPLRAPVNPIRGADSTTAAIVTGAGSSAPSALLTVLAALLLLSWFALRERFLPAPPDVALSNPVPPG